MHRYKRLMVGLNLSAQDKATIRYAAMVGRMAKSEKTYFVHIVPRLKIPMSIRLSRLLRQKTPRNDNALLHFKTYLI